MDVSRETLIGVFGEEKVENHFDEVCEFLTKHPDEYHQKVLAYYASQKYENKAICKMCGGNCCMNAPCHWSPYEVGELSYRKLKAFLKKKRYISIVRFSKAACKIAFKDLDVTDSYYYVLRTRTSDTGIAAVAAEIDEDDLCMLLGKNGCDLTYEARPYGAKLLIPKSEKRCEHLYSFETCFHDWRNHQELLKRLFKYFERREKVKSILKFVHL